MLRKKWCMFPAIRKHWQGIWSIWPRTVIRWKEWRERICSRIPCMWKLVCCYVASIPRNPWFHAVFRPFRIYSKCGKCTGKRVKTRNSSKCRNWTGIGRYVRKCLIYKENCTFGCKKLKVLFLYLFWGWKALKIASIEEKLYKILRGTYTLFLEIKS